MFYAIGKELLSKDSPSGVYGEALKLCKRNPEVANHIVSLIQSKIYTVF